MNVFEGKRARMLVAVGATALALTGCGGGESTSEDGQGVSFAAPADGDTVASPVAVEMAATGLTVEEAGEVRDGAGHFHVMVDADCVAEGEVIPKDDAHRHFGDGSTSAELELEAGEHTLCLQFADGAHVATSYTDTITITVE